MSHLFKIYGVCKLIQLFSSRVLKELKLLENSIPVTECCLVIFNLASRLNGYMYSNGTSLNVALFILMANHFVSRITLQLLGIKLFHVELPLLQTKGLGTVQVIFGIIAFKKHCLNMC